LSEANDVTTNFSFPPIFTRVETRTDWLATLRGRIGILATPASLVYVTGGLASGGVKGSTTVNFGTDCALNSCSAGEGSATLWGWTVGGGLEHAFGAGWSLKLEYLYYDLGDFSYSIHETSNVFPPFLGTETLRAETDVTGHLLRTGVSFKF